eukprot:327054-Chlamydomonas_euryale.AAC.5
MREAPRSRARARAGAGGLAPLEITEGELPGKAADTNRVDKQPASAARRNTTAVSSDVTIPTEPSSACQAAAPWFACSASDAVRCGGSSHLTAATPVVECVPPTPSSFLLPFPFSSRHHADIGRRQFATFSTLTLIPVSRAAYAHPRLAAELHQVGDLLPCARADEHAFGAGQRPPVRCPPPPPLSSTATCRGRTELSAHPTPSTHATDTRLHNTLTQESQGALFPVPPKTTS